MNIIKRDEFLNINILIPLGFIIIGLIIAPIEHSFSGSYIHFFNNPISSLFNIAIFSYFIPRIGFFASKKYTKPTQSQYCIIYFMTLLAIILGFLIIK